MNKRWVENKFSQAFISDQQLTDHLINITKKLDKDPQNTIPHALGNWNAFAFISCSFT